MQSTTLAALSRIERRLDSIETHCQSNSSTMTVSVLLTLFLNAQSCLLHNKIGIDESCYNLYSSFSQITPSFFWRLFFTTYDVPLTPPITLTIVTTDCMEEISPGWVSVVVFRQFIETGPEIPTEFRPINTDSCSNYKQWKMIVLFYNSFCWILIQFLWQLTANSINLVPAEFCPLEADPNNSLDKSSCDDLATIDIEMWETVCDNTSTPVNCRSSLQIIKTPETPENSTNLSFSDDLIKTIVTPRKIEKVREALEKEKEPHRCALKLLRYIFTAAEIRESNTDGTHGKACLDATKLNSLKGWF